MAPTIRLPHLFVPAAAVALSLGLQAAPLAAEIDADEQESEEAKGFEWTLESLFDEDETLMGPAARSMAFSHDGKYAAYLWRPFAERRHGNDLWLFDVETGEATRVTSVSVMEPFQKGAAKVAEDRLEKHEKEETGEEKAEGSWGELEDAMKGKSPEGEAEVDRRTIVDTVGEEDADDEDAPRYGGIQGFVWAPAANEMLISSGGDIYRHVIGGDDGLVKFWDTRNCGSPLLAMANHTHWVWGVRYNQFHDQLLISGGGDSEVALFSVGSLSSSPMQMWDAALFID